MFHIALTEFSFLLHVFLIQQTYYFRLKLRRSIPLCMMNILVFITVKTQLLNYLMTIIRQHVSTL
jgi:hypothetical protein